MYHEFDDPSEKKLCVNCKWFRKKLFYPNKLGSCKAPQNTKENYIDHAVIYDYEFASTCRLDKCGPQAKWFKAK